MTNNHVVFSWADRSKTLFSKMFYVLWLISHILWPVKYDHLTEHILVLVYCHSYDNNWLGTFRIVFFYTSRFYYPITYSITQAESLFMDVLSNHTCTGIMNDKTMSHIIYIKYKIRIQRIGARAYTNTSNMSLSPSSIM